MYNIFDILVICSVALFAFLGLKRGLIEEALKLAGLVLATILGMKYNSFGAALVRDILPFAEGVLTVIGFVIVFVVVYIVAQLLTMLLKRVVRSLNLAWLDRSFGFLFGMLKGMVLMAIFTWIIGVFPETGLDRKLRSTATTYLVLERFRYETVRMFGVEANLESLRSGLRKVFFLEDQPAPEESDEQNSVKQPTNPKPKIIS